MIPLYLACVTLPVFTVGRMQDGIARSFDWINLALMPAYIWRSVLLIARDGDRLRAEDCRPMRRPRCMRRSSPPGSTVLGQTLVMNRRLRQKIEAGPKTYLPRTWLAVSVPIFMVEGFYLLLTYADVIVLQQFRSPDEVAVYYAAAKTLALVAFVYFSVSAAVAHQFSEYHIAGNKARALELPRRLDQVDVLALARRDHHHPGARQAVPLAVRPAIRRRLLPDVHPGGRAARARDRRAGRAAAQHGRRAARLRARLCGGVRHQHRAVRAADPAASASPAPRSRSRPR